MSDDVRLFESGMRHFAYMAVGGVKAEAIEEEGRPYVRLTRANGPGSAVVLEMDERALREFLNEVDAARKKGGA